VAKKQPKTTNPLRVVSLLALALGAAVSTALWVALSDGLDATRGAGGVSASLVPGGGPVSAGDASVALAPAPKKPKKTKSGPQADAGSLRGSVRLYRTKEPVAGLVLTLAAAGAEPEEVETAADGSFSFDGLAPGAGYELRGERAPYAPLVLTDLTVAAGAATDVGVLWLAVPVELRAEVIDLAGRPLHGAQVLVFAPPREVSAATVNVWGAARERHILALPTVPQPTQATTTDEHGKASVPGLMPGTYRVQATAAGHAPESRLGVVLAPDAAPAPVRLVLGPGHALTGLVVDEHGEPVVQATVIAARGDSWQPGLDKWVGTSDARGRYRLEGLAAGRVTLFLLREGRPLLQVGAFGVPDTTTYDVRLRPGGTVRGTVTDEDGQPVEGAEVRTAMQNTWSPMVAKTTSEGTFELADVPAGPLAYFRVTAPGYMPYPDPSAPQQGSGESLREGAEMVRDVVLRRGLTADLTVLAAADGQPVPGAAVALYLARQWGDDHQPFEAQTDELGRASVPGLVPGEYLVVLRADGYVQEGMPPWFVNLLQSPEAMPAAWRLTAVTGGEPLVRTYRLTRGATVSGKVVCSRGLPVSGALVTATGASNEFPVFTDGEGRFEVTAVRPGNRCTATATSPDHAPGTSEPFVVLPGQAVRDVEVKLGAAGRVSGYVRTPDGRPLQGAMVRHVQGKLADNNPWAFRQFEHAQRFPVAPDGRFEVTGVTPGNVTVRADAEGYLPAWHNEVLVVADQETGGLELLLQAPLEIRGRVESQDGGPVAGAQVSAQYTGTGQARVRSFVTGLGGDPTAQTDAQGEFVVKGLKAGNYNVWAQASGFASGSRVATSTDAGPVLVTLARGRTIAGRVQDESGQGLGGVPVSAQRVERDQRQDWWWWGGNAYVYTGPDGTFEMRDLSEGTYTLVVSASWQWGREVNVEDTTLLGVTAGRQDVEIVVKAGRVIEGRLVDREARPVRVGWVSANFEAGANRPASGNQRWSQVRSDGTFRVVGLLAGTYTVMVYGSFKAKTEKGVAAGTTDLVQVRRPGTDSWQWRQQVTPGDGSFVLMGLDEGSWDVLVNVPGYVPQTLAGVVAGTTDLHVVVESGLSLSGSVAGPDGLPVQGANVQARQVAAAAGAQPVTVSARSGADGTFALSGLAMGDYRVVVYARNMAPRVLPRVSAGSENQRVVMESGTSLSGTVVDDGGQPRQGVQVSLRTEDDLQLVAAQTDVEGKFALQHVPTSGRLKLVARHYDGRAWQQHDHPETVEPGAQDVAVKLP
jgi:hypothetical protein